MSSWKSTLNSQYAPAIALICLAVWLHAADATLIATLIPVITQNIGGITLIPWTVALYEIGSIVAGAASGLLAINYGLKKPMAIAAIIFANTAQLDSAQNIQVIQNATFWIFMACLPFALLSSCLAFC